MITACADVINIRRPTVLWGELNSSTNEETELPRRLVFDVQWES